MKVFQIQPNFGRSRISAGFVKKGRISAGAGAELRYSPSIIITIIIIIILVVCLNFILSVFVTNKHAYYYLLLL